MTLSSYDIIYLLSHIFGTYVIFKFMGIFFERKDINRKLELASYVFYYASIAVIYMFFNSPTINLFCNLILFGLITLNYPSTWKVRCIAVVLIYTILVSVDAFVFVGVCFLKMNRNIDGMQTELVIALYLTNIVSYIVVLALSNFKMIKNKVYITALHWISVFIIPLGSVLLFYIMIIFNEDLTNNTEIILFSIIVLFLINVFVFYLYDTLINSYQERMEKKLLQQQNNAYIKQFELMNQSLENIKLFRHDMKNHLMVLHNLVEKDKKETSLQYLDNICMTIEFTTEYAKSGNAVVDSILNYKIQLAKQLEIEVELKLDIPTQLEIKPFDFSVILGNLLDNATDATLKLNGGRKISISIEYDRNVIYISVSNNYNGRLLYQDNKLLTTKDDKENHGLGLYNIKKVLENYNGTMNITHNDNIFSIDLIIFNQNKL